ncbi:hypothetical protein GMB86_06805 [Terrilactibacillus sp. BCM23-1]|uniref:Intracellular septation protein A n=1 Tax=Terrilactibacillus tamarindi TaxID=2599694 RepID=A0A6N8CP03_9BACI|nr:VC0807 family protein [Terrilactibacillus tamarindi]MTT31721.1 hypothetical protein [Terrilactibacillus tamarindi]
MNKNIIVCDFILYLIFPLVIWNVFKNYMDDYYAMLISSIPGIVYSIIRFILLKKINLFGVALITNLTIGILIDVLAGSAIQMLWNEVFYSYIVAFIFIVTILINKPIFLVFSLDFVEMQGHTREQLKKVFYQKKILFVFKLITYGFALREILLATIKIWLIQKYGIHSFDKGLILRQILNWTITGISMYGFIYISKCLNPPEPVTNSKPTMQENNP